MADTPPRTGWLLPVVLSLTAGSADVIVFLAFSVFTAHITGNMAILAAHYVTGRFSELGPLLAVPIFILVSLGVALVAHATEKSGTAARRTLRILQVVFLAACLSIWADHGDFPDPESTLAVLVAMLAVAAMATQNTLVRLTLGGTPSTAVMNSNLGQLAIDLATITELRGDPEEHRKARDRIGVTLPSVLAFMAGCALGGFLELRFGPWALVLPLALAAITVPLGEWYRDAPGGLDV